jgi:hypothetical protein
MKVPGFFRAAFNLMVELFGATLMDERTRQPVAKAIMICWRGKIYLFGYRGRDQVLPLFLPLKEMNSWKREIGFATHPPPDFPGKSQPGGALEQ